MKKQIVVRSFTPSCEQSAKMLESALKDGFHFVRASEFIQPQGGKAGYIEYIVEKDEDSKEEEKLREELEALREKLNYETIGAGVDIDELSALLKRNTALIYQRVAEQLQKEKNNASTT